jgi:hypothetical protein
LRGSELARDWKDISGERLPIAQKSEKHTAAKSVGPEKHKMGNGKDRSEFHRRGQHYKPACWICQHLEQAGNRPVKKDNFQKNCLSSADLNE